MRHIRRLAVLPLLFAASIPAAQASAASVTISPLAGTKTAMPATQISFLGAAKATLHSVSVLGSSSGRHRGRLRSYASATGTSFLPSKPFTPGERVRVRAQWTPSRHRSVTLTSSFTVASPQTPPTTEFPDTPGTPADVQNFLSRPDLHPPVVTVHQPGAGSAAGYLFASPFLGPGQHGPMIFDSTGRLVWFRPSKTPIDAADFRTQSYKGRTDLTWWQGRTISLGYGLGEDVIVDSHYRTVAVVRAGNGLKADEHEFLLTPQGSAYVLAYSPVSANLASAGGPSSGIAVEGVIQQIDVRTGLVMWEWHSLGRVDVSESYSKPPTTPTGFFDYFHINSLAVDRHGNVLISARNTWALYAISHATGAIAWRLAGKRSTFALGAGVQFAFQHNAEWLPNGQISLFDDEGAPPVGPPSRGEIVKLDTKHKTAALSGQLVRSPSVTTTSQGNLQALPGGGWMVGWGGLPNFTEFNAQGQMVFDAQLPRGENSYRVYRLPWSATPSEHPAIVARTVAGSTTVYVSWNGATGIASWQLLSGASAGHLTPVSSTPSAGFETAIAAPSGAYLQARALSAAGKVLATTQAVIPSAG